MSLDTQVFSSEFFEVVAEGRGSHPLESSPGPGRPKGAHERSEILIFLVKGEDAVGDEMLFLC